MAYSSIANMGYILVGLAAGTAEGVQGVLIYLAIYLITNVGVFACILGMRRGLHMVENIVISRQRSRRPGYAFVFAMLMFSLAGIPPLAGFFAKFYVFLAAVQAGLYPLAVIGVVASVVGAYYYVRIVKIIYFDEPAPAFEHDMGASLAGIIAASGCSRCSSFSARRRSRRRALPLHRSFRDAPQRMAGRRSAHPLRSGSIPPTRKRAASRPRATSAPCGSPRVCSQRAGRRGNSWISEPGNLFATLLMNAPSATAAQLGCWQALQPPMWSPRTRRPTACA